MKKAAKFWLVGSLFAALLLTAAGCDKECKEHDFTGTETITKAATCTEKGSKTVQCKNCTETTTVEILVIPHDFKGTETILETATCTSEGSKKIQCTQCDATMTDAIPMIPHDFTGTETISVNATCTSEGSKKIQCTQCDATKTAAIPVNPDAHDFAIDVETTKEASCTEKGSKTVQCKNCTATTPVEIPMLPHDFTGTETVTKAATCTEKGSKTVQCKNCTATTPVEIPVDPDAHTLEHTARVDSTCTTAGNIENWSCSVCGKKYSDEAATQEVTNTVLAAAHNYNKVTHRCKVCEAVDPAYAQAQIGETYYRNLSQAIAAGGEVKLLKDVNIPDILVVDKEVILDLNGKKISCSKNLYDESKGKVSMITVVQGGKLTVKGNGKIHSKENDCYTIDVRGGGQLVIENGDFVGNITAIQVYEGSAEIKGGTFSILQTDASKPYSYVLNLQDANGNAGTATLTVTGGSFVNFDPSHSDGENPVANFLPEGYTVTSETVDTNTVYTVTAEA